MVAVAELTPFTEICPEPADFTIPGKNSKTQNPPTFPEAVAARETVVELVKTQEVKPEVVAELSLVSFPPHRIIEFSTTTVEIVAVEDPVIVPY